jgi:tRNA(His) 5'-end guanylyltransferase
MKALSERMKRYEAASRFVLTPRMPLIVRVDGRAFHSLTRQCQRPFDPQLNDCMAATAVRLCQEIDGTQLAFTQSDEISLLIVDYTSLDTEPWFGGNLQKIVSVAASAATVAFNAQAQEHSLALPSWAMFDARAFVIPREDVVNYFIWRQQDWMRNSLTMLALSHFSHEDVYGLNKSQLHEKLFTEKGVNWAQLPTHLKNGTCVSQVSRCIRSPQESARAVIREVWTIDREPPVFTQERTYIERHVFPEGEGIS